VHVDAPLGVLAARVPATIATLTAAGDGTRLELRADSLDWVAGVLAGLGADFHIVRPDELREHPARLAARLSAA
jgi:predicted DNA-binding transcriptional regulator YafY